MIILKLGMKHQAMELYKVCVFLFYEIVAHCWMVLADPFFYFLICLFSYLCHGCKAQTMFSNTIDTIMHI